MKQLNNDTDIDITAKKDLRLTKPLYQSRHVAGGLIDIKDPEKHEMEKRGSLMYLLIHSHSTSRRCMHKEVKEFLERQTSC